MLRLRLGLRRYTCHLSTYRLSPLLSEPGVTKCISRLGTFSDVVCTVNSVGELEQISTKGGTTIPKRSAIIQEQSGLSMSTEKCQVAFWRDLVRREAFVLALVFIFSSYVIVYRRNHCPRGSLLEQA